MDEKIEVGGAWAKGQLIEAHQLLTSLGVPDRETRQDPRSGTPREIEFLLSVPERIQWLYRHLTRVRADHA